MKIDIHVHTKKIKQGDPIQRNIDKTRFAEIIKNTDVKILAITNHNHFDIEQYTEFAQSVKDVCQIWPGVELDILENGNRAHLIVIVNPTNAIKLNSLISELLDNTNPDDFTIELEEVVKKFNDLEPIYISHYHSKKPNLSEQGIEKLMKLTNDKRVIKEVSNSISAGIYISHGHNSIYGSDVQDWSKYTEIAKGLPDLRLPVESFEQFCLLLEKDNATINTILDKKTKESIQINPFEVVAELVDVEIYNDINILFGSKGTGKSKILKALSNYYNGKGFKTSVFESNTVHLDDEYDVKGKKYTTSLEEHDIDECKEELQFIRNATEEDVTNISSYIKHFSEAVTSKISKNIKITKFAQQDVASASRDFEEVNRTLQLLRQFRNDIEENEVLSDVIDQDLYDQLTDIISKVGRKVRNATQKSYIEYGSFSLFNNLIGTFNVEIAKKTGRSPKPSNTGFRQYASNRIKIEVCIKKILENINKQIPASKILIGNLGEKGEIYCQTNLVIQNGKFTDGRYTPLNSETKQPEKKFAILLESISKYVYANDLFEKINELNEIEESEKIVSLNNLLLFYRHFTVDDKEYKPSHGESSMVMLHNELMQDKRIYLIDEPEKSLGNDYISEVIVPLLKEKARLGCKVIIATHDANIAVRTLPYNSIYREHDSGKYYTYSGNPFANCLTSNIAGKSKLDWKLISMKTLEGGKSAFGERGKIYGN